MTTGQAIDVLLLLCTNHRGHAEMESTRVLQRADRVDHSLILLGDQDGETVRAIHHP